MSKIDDAFNFYKKHLYDQEKISLLQRNNLKTAGSVAPVMWELFGSVLTGRSGTGSLSGADLNGWEVKSAKEGGSFEYQYHLNTGAEKLKKDRVINHLFCTYSETYKNVVVRAISGKNLASPFFNAWEPDYFKNYDIAVSASTRRQRFRKNIPVRYVETQGYVILRIIDGVIIERHDDFLDKFNDGQSA